MKTPRDRTTSLLGLVAGLVVLAVMLVFAVLLPRVSAGGAAELGEVELPAELPGDYVAVDDETEGIPPEQVAQLLADDAYASEFIADQVGGEAASRTYAGPQLASVASVQVYGADSGPQVPAFIPDPEVRQQEQPTVEVVTAGSEGQVECVVTYLTQDPATGQPAPPGQVQGVTCQETGDGATVRVQVFGTQGALPAPEDGEAIDPAVDIVEALADDVL